MHNSKKINDAIAVLEAIGPEDLEGDRDGRVRLAAAARKLLARAETPFGRAWHLAATDPAVHAARRTLEDLGLWEGWAAAGAADTSLEELAGFCKVNCDHMLLRRLLRLLVAEHYIDEIGEDRYRATPMSRALGDVESPPRMMLQYLDNPAPQNFPKFLAKTGYENPEDPAQTNYADVDPEGLTFFQRMEASPEVNFGFIRSMEGLAAEKAPWTDVYTDTPALLEGFDKTISDVFLVDIAGGPGLDISRTLARHPELPAGSLVLQDLPGVVKLAKVSEEITLMPHDFFRPQPIKGARAYFMHAVLHDWDDIDCRRILKNIVAAMKPGYSKFLLCENVIPNVGASTFHAMADVSTMYVFSAAERTASRWTWLLAGVGLEVVKFWSDSSSPESIIEAQIPVQD